MKPKLIFFAIHRFRLLATQTNNTHKSNNNEKLKTNNKSIEWHELGGVRRKGSHIHIRVMADGSALG